MSTETRAGLIAVEGARIPLEKVEIEGDVSGAHARVRLIQRYRNEEARPVEAVYTFPLPSDATLVAFAMTCAGRRIESVVREREEAFREYDEAISSGHGGALIDQERPNVFTAQVGNLLPGEETVVELEYLQRVAVDEGTLRWMIPTLVAPRYVPGTAAGDRTAHGRESPTDQVPDADRISPPIGAADYRLALRLLFDLGKEAKVESPSHAIQVDSLDGRRRVTFAQREVALDRDIVLTVRGAEGSELSTVSSHRQGQKAGFFAVTVVPDLFDAQAQAKRQDVLFLLDVSGSMAGASIAEARSALHLCLRQLREGDRFNAIAFNDRQRKLSNQPLPLTQRTLTDADRWIDSLQAAGGTELLPALRMALQAGPEVMMLLTDGQVGNESAILAEVSRSGARTRIYSFGIGTNVSDALLRDLSRETSGAVELIHPGERIDDKVVSQFARAIASRVSDVAISFQGVEARELAPEKPMPLVDGEAWVLFGRYDSPGRGQLEIRGSRDGEPFLLKVPIELGAEESRSYLAQLWAAERIRDLEASRVTGRRGDAVRKRILELALEHRIASPYTSFVAIERRTSERLATGQAQTRVVPVHAPAGWAMFEPKEDLWPTLIPMRTRGARLPLVASIASMAHRAVDEMTSSRRGGALGSVVPAGFTASGPDSPAAAAHSSNERTRGPVARAGFMPPVTLPAAQETPLAPELDPIAVILAGQLASGLWDAKDGEGRIGQVRATAFVLLDLLDAGITSSDPRHGRQVRKGIEALLTLVGEGIDDPRSLQLALGVAWLCATGPRTRAQVDQALAAISASTALPSRLDGGEAMRRHVNALAAALR